MAFKNCSYTISIVYDFVHTFTSQDNSQQSVSILYLNTFQNAGPSLGIINEKNWTDQLDEKEEIPQDYTLTQRSLLLAIQSIDQSELNQALDQHLIKMC